MRNTSWFLAIITLLLVLSISYIPATTTPILEAKLSGEKPQFQTQEKWTYNFTLTDRWGSVFNATIYENTTNSLHQLEDYHNASHECYRLEFRPLDPLTLFIFLFILSNVLKTEYYIGEALGFGNSSMLTVFVDKDDFSLIMMHLNVNYTTDDLKMYTDIYIKLNDTRPYYFYNFPLQNNKTFGNYTPAFNVSIEIPELNYYNGSWYNYSSISLEERVTFPGTCLLYPAFKVVGSETVNVSAGRYECWKIAVLDPSNPNSYTGYFWYSSDVKNVVKMDFNATIGNDPYHFYVELTGYASEEVGLPGIALILLYNYQLQQQQYLFYGGLIAVVVVGVVVAAVAIRRKRP